jgi:hypothetical protein
LCFRGNPSEGTRDTKVTTLTSHPCLERGRKILRLGCKAVQYTPQREQNISFLFYHPRKAFSFPLSLRPSIPMLQLSIYRKCDPRGRVRLSNLQPSMTYQQQQQDMRNSQQSQHTANQQYNMQQHKPYIYPSQGSHHQPPPSSPPPSTRFDGTAIYNIHTNQPLYTYVLSNAPDSDHPESLITLRHIPTGITFGTIRRDGSSTASTC